MKRRVLLLLLMTLTSAVAWACCMVPKTYQGSIGQDEQEAVLIHDAGREELVLRINYRISGADMPETFAWVVTVPAEPDSYAVADEALFKDMFRLAQELVVPQPRSQGALALTDSIVPEGVELGKRVQVGPYDIQPVRGVGPDALTGLNTWLTAKGFPSEEPDHMTYFVENGFTFLCIRITPPKGEDAVTPNGMLPPLHLSFQSERPYYPLRFSSRQGVFNVNLHVLTRGKLDYKASGDTLARINWSSSHYRQNVKVREARMPDTLKQVFGKSAWKDKVGTWRYNNLRCTNVNHEDAISRWQEDVFFSVK